jgi:hypothetical protein
MDLLLRFIARDQLQLATLELVDCLDRQQLGRPPRAN